MTHPFDTLEEEQASLAKRRRDIEYARLRVTAGLECCDLAAKLCAKHNGCTVTELPAEARALLLERMIALRLLSEAQVKQIEMDRSNGLESEGQSLALLPDAFFKPVQ